MATTVAPPTDVEDSVTFPELENIEPEYPIYALEIFPDRFFYQPIPVLATLPDPSPSLTPLSGPGISDVRLPPSNGNNVFAIPSDGNGTFLPGIFPDRTGDNNNFHQVSSIIPDRQPVDTIPDPLPAPGVIPDRFEPDALLPDRMVNITPFSIPIYPFASNGNQTIRNVTANITTGLVDRETGLTIYNSRICGFVGYCKDSAYRTCRNTTINSCEDCDQVGAAFFVFLISILGLAILIGNALIIAVGNYRRRKGKTNKMDICRSSLAVADLLTGVQLLVLTMYNFSWTSKLTSFELNAEQLALRGSWQAFFGGILHTFIYTSSLYHLLYIGLQRVYAIQKPISYKWQSKSVVYIGLGIVWLLAILTATIPAWFPNHLTFSYNVPSFLFLPTLQNVMGDIDFTPAVALMILFFVIPYAIMTVSTIACGIIIRVNYVRRTHKLTERSTREGQSDARQQKINVFVTVAIMQLGFTVTLLPAVLIACLFYTGYLDCFNYSTPYLICFYLSMSNSLINIIVYNFRDKIFRSNLKKLLSTWVSCFSSSNEWKSKSSSGSKGQKSETTLSSNAAKKSPKMSTTTFNSRTDSATNNI